FRGIGPARGTGSSDVLVVLAAAGNPAPSRSGEHQSTPHPVLGHFGHGVLHHGVPVPVSEVDRQVPALLGKLRLDGGDHLPIQLVDRGNTTEVVVVLGDLVEPLRWNTTSSGDVLQEGPHVLRPFRAPKRQQQQRIKAHDPMMAARAGRCHLGGCARWPTPTSDFPPVGVHDPTACTPPSTMIIDPVVLGSQSDSTAHTDLATGVGSVTSHPSGALSPQLLSSSLKPGIDLAAMVRTGPAETRFTRIPLGPRSRAKYREVDSSAA